MSILDDKNRIWGSYILLDIQDATEIRKEWYSLYKYYQKYVNE